MFTFAPIHPLPEVMRVSGRESTDSRGLFMSLFPRTWLDVFPADKVICLSRSNYKVLRGMHWQRGMSKLVRCISGAIQDIVVDIRAGSRTFGRHVSVDLSGELNLAVYVPDGFAHGFEVLGDRATVLYGLSTEQDPAREGFMCPYDPELQLPWRRPGHTMSDRDRHAQSFAAYRKDPAYVGVVEDS